jgi:hypothetical protein
MDGEDGAAARPQQTLLPGRRRVVFSDLGDGAGLRALGTFARVVDVADMITDCERVEPSADDAVAMEIELIAICCFDKPIILLGHKLGDAALVGAVVILHVASLATNVVLKLPASGVERVADRDMDVHMSMVGLWIVEYDDPPSRHMQHNVDAEDVTPMMPPMRPPDHDAAGCDARLALKLLKLADTRIRSCTAAELSMLRKLISGKNAIDASYSRG